MENSGKTKEELLLELQDCKECISRLEQLDEIHKSLLNSTPDAIVIYDLQGHALYINESFVRTFGWTRDEVLEKSIPYLPDSERNVSMRNIRRIIDEGGVANAFETKRLTKDGSLLDVSISASRFNDHAGKPAGMVVFLRDITQRKLTEKALRESEGSYRGVFDSMNDAILVHDMETGNIVDVNRKMCEMYGYTAQETRNLSVGDISFGQPPYSQEDAVRWVRKAADGESQLFDWLSRNRDGGLFWTEVNLKRAVIGGKERILAVVRDISERKRTEEALRSSEELQRTILATSPVGIGLARDRRMVWVNHAWGQMFGFEQDDASYLDFSVRQLYPTSEEFERVGKILYDGLSTGQVNDTDASMCRKDGAVFDAHITLKAIDPSDLHKGTIAIIMDITARKHAEQERASLRNQLLQAQKMQAIGTLTGGIAHDFNNMLTIILGYSELLLDETQESDPRHSDLEKIGQTARSGADLVQRLLTFSRQTEAQPRRLNLNDRIRQIDRLLSKTIPKMVEIRLILADDLAPIKADPAQMEQVVMNLAVNASEAMPDGGILTVETRNVILDEGFCRTHHGTKPGDYVLLRISDTGRGMDAETKDRMFDPFFTTKGWDSRKGTGLGLPVVQGVIQQHGGCIECFSQAGKGTTFDVYLPVTKDDAASNQEAGKLVPRGGSETILVVEDEDHIRDLGKRYLDRAGYTVLEARNGREALELYRRETKRISLIILDLIMPEMGGKQCMEQLVKINPEAKVLIASGYSSGGSEKEVVQLGAKGYVGKPFDMRQLLQAVRDVLDEK
ncbi:MAG: PAS domain S-box protein [Desulfomonile tiedjei]|nr:PAS domain S-box protein [Desulfomonile tiedjei]